MSGKRPIYNDGQILTTPDLQRIADDAAAQDDLVYAVLLSPGSVQKRIVPLSEETGTVNPRLLLIPSTTNGKVAVQPCHLVAGVVSAPFQVALAATIAAAADSAQIATNASGLTRIDLVYVTLARNVITTGTRKIKSVSDGSLSTPTINLEDEAQGTVQVLAGTPGGGAPALPADTATAFNFAVGEVTVLNGFVAGNAILQSAIAQTWSGGFIPSQRVRGYRPMSVLTSGQPYSPAIGATGKIQNDRWGSDGRWFGGMKYVTNPTTAILDSSQNWQKRWIEIRGALPVADGGLYKPADQVALGGAASNFSSGLILTGTNGAVGTPCYTVTSSGATFKFWADSLTGVLAVNVTGAPNDAVNGDNWIFTVSTEDPFSF